MKAIEKIEKTVERAAEFVDFEITYIPGVMEDQDSYKASNQELSINCYAPTEKEAIGSARMEAIGELMGKFSLAEKILKSAMAKRKVSKPN